ncbi:MAG: hypothetical protein WB217_00530 [Mesobacillus sp.]|uniref:hypothetical protein n=1 Tax=Mesobacillus sp. TaxID=2675271 RepID=UPI003C311339
MECQASPPGTLAVDKLENVLVYSLIYLSGPYFYKGFYDHTGKNLQSTDFQ